MKKTRATLPKALPKTKVDLQRERVIGILTSVILNMERTLTSETPKKYTLDEMADELIARGSEVEKEVLKSMLTSDDLTFGVGMGIFFITGTEFWFDQY